MQGNDIKVKFIPHIFYDIVQSVSPDINELMRKDDDQMRQMQQRLMHMQTLYI